MACKFLWPLLTWWGPFSGTRSKGNKDGVDS
nr:MAG TPA: hypothetical protein [Caudoviricetes sp.]